MNSTSKFLIACLVVTGLWIGVQSLNRPKPDVVPACDSAATGGG